MPRRDYGGHLSPDSRGIFIWRRKNPKTGKRESRSTGQDTIGRARQVAQEWEEEFDRIEVGLAPLNDWTADLEPLVERWAAQLEGSKRHREQLKQDLRRALRALELVRASDLDAVGKIDDRLRALEGTEIEGTTITRTMIVRSFQGRLKRFSAWLAGNRRHLDRDPLVSWEPIPAASSGRKGRAFEPEETGRALLAVDRLDELRRTKATRVRQRAAFTALLITAPRATVFLSRQVDDLLEDRLDLGAGNDVKRVGRGALDPATLEELRAHTKHVRAERANEERRRAELGHELLAGPVLLFPGPTGARWSKERLLDRWQEAFGLGLVDELWPSDVERDLQLALDVTQALAHGRALVSRGGNPKRVTEETEIRRVRRRRYVEQLADRLRESWEERMDGVTLHAFRSTHKTWATARRVLGNAIDLQLGWAKDGDKGALEVMRLAAGSRTGRKHYLDVGSSLIDPGESARAVREVLDEALAAIAAEGRSVLLPRVARSASG